MLYGPNVDDDRNVTESEGKIAGEEFLAFAGDPSPGRENVRLMVGAESFHPHDACIVTGPSSGLRGIYGAIATSGEWD